MQPINITISIPLIAATVSLASITTEVSFPRVEVVNGSACEPAHVIGSNGVYEASVNSGEEITLPPAITKNTLGTEIASLDPGESKVILDSKILNSLGELVDEIPAASEKALNDIKVFEIDGSGVSVPAQRDYTCQFKNIRVLESDGTLRDTITSFSNDHVLPAPIAIGYKRIIPNQHTSYRIGDTGWHLQNGTFDYSDDSKRVLYNQELDYANYGSDGMYYLVNDNVFGNKHRYTNSIGAGPNVGKAGFDAAGFDGAISNYIIDNYTGIAFSNYNHGLINAASGSGNTWQNVIDIILASNENGFDDWFPLSCQHILAMFNMESNYESYNNIGYGISATTLAALGDTVLSSPSSVYFLRRGLVYIQTASPASTSTVILKARNHF